MEYPESKFKKPLRRAMLITFVAAFFVISPLLIMYTSGYRYDWHNGLFRETGAVNIDVEPANATVYLNDLKLSGKMPFRLNNLTPGGYHLRVTASGYFDWQKDIEVKSKQTVYIKEIVMIKKEKPTALAEGAIKELALSADGRFLIYKLTKGTDNEIWLRDNQTEKASLLFSHAPSNPLFVWALKNNFVAISETAAPFKQLIVVNAERPEQPLNLSARINEPIKKYSWKETAEPELFFGTDKKIYSFLPATTQIITVAKGTYLDWLMENGQLWTLQKDASGDLKIIRDTLGFSSEFYPDSRPADITLDETYIFLASHGNSVLLKKTGADEGVLMTPSQAFKISADEVLISRYNDWWLIWTPWELNTYSEGEVPYLLNRSGESLRAVIPLDKYNTLGLAWQDKTTVLFPYYLVNHNLIDTPISSGAADPENRIFYFSGKWSGQEGLWQLKY